MNKFVVIGDIQGCADELELLIDKLGQEGLLKTHRLCFLGDYIDRGPNSKRVLEILSGLQKRGAIMLLGNHEHMLLKALKHKNDNYDVFHFWFYAYQDHLFSSYDLTLPHVINRDNMPEIMHELEEALGSHRDFLLSLKPYFMDDDYLFIHAGLTEHESLAVQLQTLDGLSYDPDENPPQIYDHRLAVDVPITVTKKIVVTGHKVFQKPIKKKNRVHINCGPERGGPLVAWVSDQDRFVQVLAESFVC